jgi:ribosome-binding factor A
MESKRPQQIGELIKRNFAFVFQNPGIYIYGYAFVTVISVKIVSDLAQANVYLSIYNAEDKSALLQKSSQCYAST